MTTWFNKEPGNDVAASDEDPSMLLIGASHPDWIRLPPELGGAQVRVRGVKLATCPRGTHNVRHYDLEGDVCVAECTAHGGFLWYRRVTP